MLEIIRCTELNPALIRVVHTAQELQYGTFTTACLADNGIHFASLEFEARFVEDGRSVLNCIRVFEADLFEHDATRPRDAPAIIWHVTNKRHSVNLSHELIGGNASTSKLPTLLYENWEEYGRVNECLDANPVFYDLYVVAVIGNVSCPLAFFAEASQGPAVKGEKNEEAEADDRLQPCCFLHLDSLLARLSL